MIYCPECGEQNEDDAEFCAKCGASLKPSRISRRYRREREMCFGVPVGGYTWALLFGLVIVLWGASQLVGFNLEFWPIFAVVFGLIILVTALRRTSSR